MDRRWKKGKPGKDSTGIFKVWIDCGDGFQFEGIAKFWNNEWRIVTSGSRSNPEGLLKNLGWKVTHWTYIPLIGDPKNELG